MASPSIRPSALKGGQSGDPHRALVFWSQRGKLLFETALAEYSDRNNGEVRSGLFAGGSEIRTLGPSLGRGLHAVENVDVRESAEKSHGYSLALGQRGSLASCISTGLVALPWAHSRADCGRGAHYWASPAQAQLHHLGLENVSPIPTPSLAEPRLRRSRTPFWCQQIDIVASAAPCSR
jgi:hypothetical protein